MELAAARALAQDLLAEHGLDGWTVVLDRARVRAGVCRADRRETGLSRVLTALHDEAQVRDTVLHEVAHALVGPGHGHDAAWRAQARALGCSGDRCLPEDAPRAPAPWRGVCPAGHVATRHRRPERVASCRRCSRSFDPRALLVWRLHGREVPEASMSPRYQRELAAVRAAAGAVRRG